MTENELITALAKVIGRRPCERCRMAAIVGGMRDCSMFDCRELYRQEARDVVEWLKDKGVLK